VRCGQIRQIAGQEQGPFWGAKPSKARSSTWGTRSAILCKDEIAYLSEIANKHITNTKFGYGHSKTVINMKKSNCLWVGYLGGNEGKKGKSRGKREQMVPSGLFGVPAGSSVPDHCILGHSNKLAVSFVPTPCSHSPEDLECLAQH